MKAFKLKKIVLSLVICSPLCLAMNAQADHGDEITIIGTKLEARQIAGSGSVIDKAQIKNEVATDINQLIKTIPGTYVQEEDGLGLRPNIGIRGATSERSGKVTLMEDGVMIAPAPYSNPAAYYFPTAMRLYTVEVLKGAPLLRYGPQTTGGVVNLISTPIPEQNQGRVRVTLGEDGQQDVLLNYGGTQGQFGWLLETAQRDHDGFKKIDRSDRNTGYDIEDYLVKLKWTGDNQSLLFKAQHSEETSNETYLGLTDADFNANPYRRYGLSEIDQMNNDHDGFNLVYNLNINDDMQVIATAYKNEFARDWFKLGGGSKFVNAANQGDLQAQAVLNGSADAQGLKYKHNNRAYESKGLDINFELALAEHQISIGVRKHKDSMDRFQPEDLYNQVNGGLVYSSTKQPSGSNNRLEEAEAFSAWLTDDWQITDNLNVNLALRYEDVESQRIEFADGARSTVKAQRANDSSELLPGVSFTYDLNDAWHVLAGYHKGFSPLGGGAKANEEAETSHNYEAGVRYEQANTFFEAIAFYSDFDNKTEFCSNANPCSNGADSGSFITGQAIISGLELQLSHQFELSNSNIPVDLTYTYTNAEVDGDNFTGFNDGDSLAAIPENTASLRIGLEPQSGWNHYVVAKLTDELCVNVGCNRSNNQFDKTDSFVTLDYISHYPINEQFQLFLKAENVFDEVAIVSRQPDGARPNKPRTVSAGFNFSF